MDNNTTYTNTPSWWTTLGRMMSDIRRSAFFQSFKGDRVLWQIIVLLSAISLLAVFSATSSLADLNGKTAFVYLRRQFLFIAFSILLVYVAHITPYYLYRNFAKLILFLSFALLIFTFIVGAEFNEASRRIELFGVTFQPSELAKFAIILYIAKVLEEHSKDNTLNNFKKYLWRIIVPVAALCVLLIRMGSTSVALLLGFTVFIVLIVARVRSSYLWKTLAIALTLLGVIVLLSYTTPMFTRVKKMVDNRVLVFFAPEDSERATEALTFQSDNAKIAVASGGFIGKGPGNSTQRHILPNAYDDFIFAIIVEEYGLWGCSFVLLLYLWMFYRVVVIVRSCRKIFYSVVILGIMLQIVFQALLHMGVSVGLLPVTGQTLPLVSHGGSSLITTGFALGIVLSISREAEEQEKREKGMNIDKKEEKE